MNVPFVVPEDDTTPYPADFERVVACVREMGYALDIIEEGRAGGAIFDRVPFLVSFDAAGRFLSIRALWEPDIPAETGEQAMFATADNWNREKYFPTVYWMLDPEGSLQVCADFADGLHGDDSRGEAGRVRGFRGGHEARPVEQSVARRDCVGYFDGHCGDGVREGVGLRGPRGG